MQIIESKHWQRKKRFRRNIEPYMIESVISGGPVQRDKIHDGALNAIGFVPQTGKTLKVVFRRITKEKVKLITASYLD